MKTVEIKDGVVDICRVYDDNNNLTSEGYSIETLISLSRLIKENGEFKEIYTVNGKVVTNEKYEKARKKYPQMPASAKENDFILQNTNLLIDVLSKVGESSEVNINDMDIVKRDESLSELMVSAVKNSHFLGMEKPCI